MFRSCNKTRFISRIWLRFDTVNKLMWLCKNRTCEFKACKVQLWAQSEWRKLTLPGQLFACKWKFEVLGLQIKAKVILSSDQPADVSFYFFSFLIDIFCQAFFFFFRFFYYFTKWKVIGKTANTNVRSKLKPQSFEMWDKQVICTFK